MKCDDYAVGREVLAGQRRRERRRGRRRRCQPRRRRRRDRGPRAGRWLRRCFRRRRRRRRPPRASPQRLGASPTPLVAPPPRLGLQQRGARSRGRANTALRRRRRVGARSRAAHARGGRPARWRRQARAAAARTRAVPRARARAAGARRAQGGAAARQRRRQRAGCRSADALEDLADALVAPAAAAASAAAARRADRRRARGRGCRADRGATPSDLSTMPHILTASRSRHPVDRGARAVGLGAALPALGLREGDRRPAAPRARRRLRRCAPRTARRRARARDAPLRRRRRRRAVGRMLLGARRHNGSPRARAVAAVTIPRSCCGVPLVPLWGAIELDSL